MRIEHVKEAAKAGSIFASLSMCRILFRLLRCSMFAGLTDALPR